MKELGHNCPALAKSRLERGTPCYWEALGRATRQDIIAQGIIVLLGEYSRLRDIARRRGGVPMVGSSMPNNPESPPKKTMQYCAPSRWIAQKLWRWDVTIVGAFALYALGANAMYGDDYLVAAALYFAAVCWLVAKSIASEETRSHEQRRGISVIIFVMGIAVFGGSLVWINHRRKQVVAHDQTESPPPPVSIAAPPTLTAEESAKAAVLTERYSGLVVHVKSTLVDKEGKIIQEQNWPKDEQNNTGFFVKPGTIITSKENITLKGNRFFRQESGGHRWWPPTSMQTTIATWRCCFLSCCVLQDWSCRP